MKELLKRFHLNGNTIGFHPQTQKLELHTSKLHPVNILLKRVHFNGQTTRFYPQALIMSEPQIQFIKAVNGKVVQLLTYVSRAI